MAPSICRYLPLCMPTDCLIIVSTNVLISAEGLEALQAAIHDSYGDVPVKIAIHTDPEEDWTKPIITVHSGINDYDYLMDVEDKFFHDAETNPILIKVLPLVVISQA